MRRRATSRRVPRDIARDLGERDRSKIVHRERRQQEQVRGRGRSGRIRRPRASRTHAGSARKRRTLLVGDRAIRSVPTMPATRGSRTQSGSTDMSSNQYERLQAVSLRRCSTTVRVLLLELAPVHLAVQVLLLRRSDRASACSRPRRGDLVDPGTAPDPSRRTPVNAAARIRFWVPSDPASPSPLDRRSSGDCNLTVTHHLVTIRTVTSGGVAALDEPKRHRRRRGRTRIAGSTCRKGGSATSMKGSGRRCCSSTSARRGRSCGRT